MYTILAILLAAGLILLTVLGARAGGKRTEKRFLFMELILAGSALLAGGLTPPITHGMIFGGDGSAEWMGWAWDAFVLFVKTTLPFTLSALLLMIATVLVTVFTQKKARVFSAVVRQTASLAVSVLLLFLSPFYSAMAETDGATVHIAILVFGVCEALLMRLVFVCERALGLWRKQ